MRFGELRQSCGNSNPSGAQRRRRATTMASQVASDLENMDVNEESSDFAKKSAARHKAMKAKWATHKS